MFIVVLESKALKLVGVLFFEFILFGYSVGGGIGIGS